MGFKNKINVIVVLFLSFFFILIININKTPSKILFVCMWPVCGDQRKLGRTQLVIL